MSLNEVEVIGGFKYEYRRFWNRRIHKETEDMKGIRILVLIGLIWALVSVGCVTPKNEAPCPPMWCGFQLSEQVGTILESEGEYAMT